jgi:hypothetical protein
MALEKRIRLGIERLARLGVEAAARARGPIAGHDRLQTR